MCSIFIGNGLCNHSTQLRLPIFLKLRTDVFHLFDILEEDELMNVTCKLAEDN